MFYSCSFEIRILRKIWHFWIISINYRFILWNRVIVFQWMPYIFLSYCINWCSLCINQSLWNWWLIIKYHIVFFIYFFSNQKFGDNSVISLSSQKFLMSIIRNLFNNWNRFKFLIIRFRRWFRLGIGLWFGLWVWFRIIIVSISFLFVIIRFRSWCWCWGRGGSWFDVIFFILILVTIISISILIILIILRLLLILIIWLIVYWLLIISWLIWYFWLIFFLCCLWGFCILS